MNESSDQRYTPEDLERFLVEGEPFFRNTCRQLAGNNTDGDDLCHDTWIAVKQAVPTYRGQCHPMTFVYKIARHRLVSWRRQQARRPTMELDSGIPARATPTTVRGMRHTVRRTFSDDEIYILSLRGAGHALKEIAAIFDISEEAMKKRYQRLTARVRELAREPPR